MIRPGARGLTVVTLVVAVVACSSGEERGVEPTTTAGAVPSSTTVAASAVADVAPAVADALSFEAPTVGGGRFVGAEYAGRTLALWFWAPY